MKLLTFLLLCLVAAGCWGAYLLKTPYGPSAETFVEIPQGTGTAAIAGRLAQAGVIRTPLAFELTRRLRGGRLKAGEYRFDHPATVGEVYARIARGDVYTVALVIPEGYNLFDIAAAVEAAKLGDAPGFLHAEQTETRLVRDLDPNAPTLEGYLFPDTYRFPRHTTPQNILAAMVKRFRQETASLAIPAGDTPRIVTLASLIEREVRFDSERPLVAGVFRNRMALGMPLQTDPAVIYAALLDGRWRGTIYRSDLQSPSPYNTYTHTGLPPSPIDNPGLPALRAALHPAETDFLYFEASAGGHTVFSRDLAGHNAQVQAYAQTRPSPGQGTGASGNP